jgi:hypothetical protein
MPKRKVGAINDNLEKNLDCVVVLINRLEYRFYMEEEEQKKKDIEKGLEVLAALKIAFEKNFYGFKNTRPRFENL